MTDNILTFDFETKDPYITLKLGGGWPYAFNVQDSGFKAIGCGVMDNEGSKSYITDWDELLEVICKHDTLLGHGAIYDVGILHVIYKNNKEALSKINSMTILDTQQLFQLWDSSIPSYKLDALAKKYLNEDKGCDILMNVAWDNDLYPWLKKELTAKDKCEKSDELYVRKKSGREAKILKHAYKIMDVLQEVDYDAMAEYAIKDIDLTYKLYKYVIDEVSAELVSTYSDLTHTCVAARLRGVRVDLKKAREIQNEFIPIIHKKLTRLYVEAGEEFNLNSSKALAKILDKRGMSYPATAVGNPSITSPWLIEQKDEFCKLLADTKAYIKIKADYVDKIIDMQQYSCPDAVDYGIVYPELKILEARTGRFSCGKPNLQQVPSRDPILGEKCRSMYVPFPGEKWYSLDYKGQELRVQIHYASLLGCEGADEYVTMFNKNPLMCLHTKVGEMLSIEKSMAKSINFGLSYGMGVPTLAKHLGISETEARGLRDRYDEAFPYLNQLSKHCKKAIRNNGRIKTICSRYCGADRPVFKNGKMQTFEYKALNKLIQGSANDMITECMVQAHKAGIPILFPVHDEICMSGTKEQAIALKEIMENAVKLVIPTPVSVNLEGGESWSDGDH